MMINFPNRRIPNMKQFNSLAIGLVAVIAIAPTAGAFAPTDNAPQNERPAANHHAQVNVNVGIGIGQPRPQPRVIVVESEPQPQQNVVVVETSQRSGSNYRSRQRWYSKHSYKHGWGHSKHQEDHDDD
jgi:hypothetical protein